ncbi:hypothetical protein JCGZ_18236 [Jatropha curcas]|uniref:Aminotransferase-like plant mobile domain-containing protein n=1 Tax=Jatropha curcas TaxID=180498 RepID=A0A067KE19_JATCU|nr:hypothetical protein JCGZ_18236 [Jatropha curcas]
MYAVGEWFDRLPPRVQDRVWEAEFCRFIDMLPMVQERTVPASIIVVIEQWMDTTHTFHLPFGKMTITPMDFTTITGLPFGGLSIVFDDQLRTLDRLDLRESLRAAVGIEPIIFDKRVLYESIISHYEAMPQDCVAGMDMDVQPELFCFTCSRLPYSQIMQVEVGGAQRGGHASRGAGHRPVVIEEIEDSNSEDSKEIASIMS